MQDLSECTWFYAFDFGIKCFLQLKSKAKSVFLKKVKTRINEPEYQGGGKKTVLRIISSDFETVFLLHIPKGTRTKKITDIKFHSVDLLVKTSVTLLLNYYI